VYTNLVIPRFHPDPSICRAAGFTGVFFGLYAAGASVAPAFFE
jgi:hypothetical protein